MSIGKEYYVKENNTHKQGVRQFSVCLTKNDEVMFKGSLSDCASYIKLKNNGSLL